MANVNLERRAEIGQEKRARTRAQLIAAASALFAKRSWASVTIDDLVREAGVAKGTFYVHFEDMHALTVAVAGDAFIERALEDPAWGALVARMARSNPSVGETARRRLKEDLARVIDNLPGAGLSVDLALEAAIGVVLQVLAAIGEGRLKGAVAQPAVGAVLGAIGIGKQQAAATLAKLKRAKAAPIERAPAA